MSEEQIVYTALENLLETTQFKGEWDEVTKKGLDGTLRVRIGENVLQFNVKVKKELRKHMLPQIFAFNEAHQPFLLIAGRLYPGIKQELRNHNVSYLEANGNLYLKTPEKWFWIEVNKPMPVKPQIRSRAFTKTGLRILFAFLRDQALINLSYRQIAGQTSTSIGNITHIINGLKQEGYVVNVSKNEYQFQRLNELLSQWAEAYEQTLKPTLSMGRFRFVDKDRFDRWKKLKLNTPKTLWGSEPAGELLTGYLKPAELTIYTEESRSELIKNYRLIPDGEGLVRVYRKFWQQQEADQHTVPPLLVYADLINSHDRRCSETAQKLYDEYLQTALS
ncbi:type IV toxin-antitoxin system AbiEi family antitoxin [Arundinibacter roseus]|uniref:Uncharacterized protein n=1 Tax=Arundinibacter roseus TaxID=2070510 RepID=A0A4R4JTI2_9BACT|nr:type IV toxin-antitoxin system AbiEi family antitoxin [Arundinibacter roseus]TDB57950.1 hypothetical protein EZE20_23435 [Arundinibacter roseus]